MQKKFSLIMPVYQSENHLKLAIDSVLDNRDYDNWELIVSFDGASEEGEKIVKSYTDPRIKYIVNEHKGACAARNRGAEIATGDYFAFYSSDFMAYPGMLSTWAKYLDENPDCAFVYGGYDLMENGKVIGAYNSEPFDIKQLKTANYIDGGFPVRKEAYIPWDENCISLNDWDFWLNIIAAGHKGYFMNNRTYAAEIPRPKGLSYDSNANWLERVKYIKIKHKIPDNPICITSLGAPFHAKRMADILGNADFKAVPQFKPHEYKMVYLLGFYVNSADAHAKVFSGSGKTNNIVKAVHWIGTDVFMLGGMNVKDMRVFKDYVANNMDYNLAEYPYTQRELQDFGIQSKIGGNVPVVPFPVEDVPEMPLPEKFTVAVYAPNSSDAEWKYRLDVMRQVAMACPDIQFIFFGGAKGEEYNIKAVGWTDIKEVIRQSSCLMRLATHDGLPIAPIQFLLGKRQVVTNVPMPYSEFMNFMSAESMCEIGKSNFCDSTEYIINRLRRLQKGYNSIKYDWDRVRGFWLRACGVEGFKERVNCMLERKPLIDVPFTKEYYAEGSLLGVEKTEVSNG